MNEEQLKNNLIALSRYEEIPFRRIGIVFDTLGPSQSLITCIPNLNQTVKLIPHVSMSVFYVESDSPAITIKTSCYQAMDSWFLQGHLIATSFNSLKCIKDFSNSKIYYYIQDLEYNRPYFNTNIKEYKQIISDSNIIKIFRSKDHFDQFVRDGIIDKKVKVYIMEDMLVKPILEIINAES